jgi:hypothetical protein
MQSHYLGILLAPTIVLFWILAYRVSKNSKSFIKKTLIGLGLFSILMSPLLFFDIRHNFLNFKAFEALFAAREGVANFSLSRAIAKIPTTFVQINTTLLGAKNGLAGLTVSLAMVVLAFFMYLNPLRRIQNTKLTSAYVLLLSWIGFGAVGFSFYKLPVYDHYFGFLFPAPFLLLGGLAENIRTPAKVVGKYFIYLLLTALVIVNFLDNPLRYNPNYQLQRSQNVAKKVLMEEKEKPFDLAVLAERNYEDGYRYFLELWGGIVLHADRWDQKTIVNDLIVICEMEEKKCDPTHSPKAEIANFGMSKIDAQWEVNGVIIYRLVHTK